MSEGEVRAGIQQQVGVIEFSHPKANSLPSPLLTQLADEITRLSADSGAKVLLIKSGGEKAFCAGASFDELLSLEDEGAAKEYFLGFAKVILAIRSAKKFVVCRVQGSAVGGAVGLVAASDLAFATAQAKVRLSELALGFGPFVIAEAVKRKLGAGAFTELAALAEWRDAQWAKDRGLFNEVFPNQADLDTALEERCLELSSRSLSAMKKLKTVAWEGTDHWSSLLYERAQESAKLVLTESVQSEIRSVKGG